MAKGFQRQGDWQTGYVQRSVPTRDAKVAEQKAIQLAKRADEETKKRVQSAKQLEAEAKRIFEVQTGLDRYEAQKAADMSATFKNFMTKTVSSVAKSMQDAARAEGAADAILEDETPTETVETNQALKDITEASNKNIEISTKVEKEIAEPLEKIGELDKANKARGIFSSAYKFGYESKRASLAVDGFSAKLKSELDSSEVLLQRKDDDVPWRIKDAKTKDQLRFASGYLLNEFIEEQRGTLGDITVAELIGKPAKKAISKELKTRYDAIDLEFKENQIAAITNHLGASMEMLPGAATLTTDLSTLEARLRPYLTATSTKSKGALLKDTISDTFKDVISRSANPELVKKNFLEAATKLKLDTSMGLKTLAEIDPSLFSKSAIDKLYVAELSKRYTNEVKGQKQNATLAIINKSNEISERMEKEGTQREDYAGEMLLFKAKLMKENPYAVGEITNLMEKFFTPTLGESDTILKIKRSYQQNNGVVLAKDLDDVNLKVAKTYMETNEIPLVEESPSEIYKDHIREKEQNAEKIFDKVNKIANVTILEGNEREALDQFNWEVHQRALQIQGAANVENVTLTYKTAYAQAWSEKSREVSEGFTDPNSKWFVTVGAGGGFKHFDKANVDPFETNIPDIQTFDEISKEANGRNGQRLAKKKLWITDPKRLSLLGNGYSNDPLIQRSARVLGLTEKEFVELQRSQFPEGTFEEILEDDPEFSDIINGAAKNSKAANDVKILSQNGNADSTTVKKAIDEVVPLGGLVLSNHFLDRGELDKTLINEITVPGLSLDAGEVQIIDGVEFKGHRKIGFPREDGEVSDQFGWRIHPITGKRSFHYGSDIGTTGEEGYHTAINITNGTVVSNESHINYGVMLGIRDNDTGHIYRFAHLKNYNPELEVGAFYNGQPIGEVGTTGRSTKIHLHFEKMVDGELIDPKDDLNRLSMGKLTDSLDNINRKFVSKTYDGFVGKYPIPRNLVARATRKALDRNWGMGIKEFEKNEKAQDATWKWLNEQSWPVAFRYAQQNAPALNVDPQALAIRYHVSQLITGNMLNYEDPDVKAYTDQYMENLRTAGTFK